jgi:arylsulfatase A-like enzyme/Tfp pilus assembly protein PilF
VTAVVAFATTVAIASAWAILYHQPSERLRHAACRGCNVLLVTIDTLRTDRVGAFGGRAGVTPTLDRLAREGLRLTRAYSSAPLTLPSHTSILTAVSPPRHGVRANGLFRLGPELPTLATTLKAAGYRTGAFVGAFVLDARFGLNRGFDVYDDRYGEHHAGEDTDAAERRAEEVITPAAAWILGRHTADPWFAWIHLYDPHEPYRAPEPYASRFPAYDAEVAYADAMVGRLLDDLTVARQLDHTLVIVVADHGESLGEHGERSHGVFAYDVTVRVPWIIWAGSRVNLRQWDGLSRLIDLAPTTLDLAGIAPPAQFEGRSLLAAINGDGSVSPPAYIEAMDANVTRNWAPLTAMVSRNEKFIDLPIPELYDLASDPNEAVNLFARDGERSRALQVMLRMTTASFAASGAAIEPTRLDADARARLQALGYIGSAAGRPSRAYTEADDPKVLIGAADELNQALMSFKQGDIAHAITSVRGVIQAHPAFTTAYGVLASMQRDRGELRDAIATLEEVVRRGVADQSVLVVLAGYLQEGGAAAKSAELLEAVVAQHPDYADAYNSLGVAYSRLGRHDRAQSAFRKVLELDPTSATAYENLGIDASARGALSAAREDLERALDLDPRLAGAHNALAAVLMRQGRREDALEHWRTAVQQNPHLYDALYNLGTVLYSAQRRDEARPYLERFVAEASPTRYGSDIARVRRLLVP